MATNAKLKKKKAERDRRDMAKDVRWMNHFRSFTGMKARQGSNYRKPGV